MKNEIYIYYKEIFTYFINFNNILSIYKISTNNKYLTKNYLILSSFFFLFFTIKLIYIL
jgi:hypothetical protein